MKNTLLLLILLPLLSFGQGANDASADSSTITALDYVKKGDENYFLGNYFEAISDYSEAIGINPECYIAYNKRALANFELGYYDGAVGDFGKAITINPDSFIAYYNRGRLLKDITDFIGAISDFTEVIRLKPDYAMAYELRGHAKYKHGLPHCSDYKKCCELGLERCCMIICTE